MVKTARIAVVTGAAQGIGRRTAELLAQRGYALALSDLRPLAETLRAVEELGANALEFVGEISDEQVVSRLAAAVQERWGRADVVAFRLHSERLRMIVMVSANLLATIPGILDRAWARDCTRVGLGWSYRRAQNRRGARPMCWSNVGFSRRVG